MDSSAITNNEPSTSNQCLVPLEQQLVLQRLEEQRCSIAQHQAKEILRNLQDLSFDFDKITTSMHRIHSQCLSQNGYPGISHGVLGSVDTEIGNIIRTKEKFSRNFEKFQVILNQADQATPAVKEQCLRHASTMSRYLKHDVMNIVCSNLLQCIAGYQYNDIKQIGETAKVHHGEMAKYKEEFGYLPMKLAISCSSGQYNRKNVKN